MPFRKLINMRTLISLLLIAFSLVACNSKSHSDVDVSLQTFSEGNTAFPAVEAGDTLHDDVNGIPMATPEVYAAGNLNPPHGEPGHDCSIAVGAPLKAPVNSASPASQGVMPSAAPAGSLPVTGRLNPPHGQPGHVCEIPVGQPLP